MGFTLRFIKIYLLDGKGNEHREFDLDVVYKGYSLNCDYGDDAPMIPYFIYKILE